MFYCLDSSTYLKITHLYREANRYAYKGLFDGQNRIEAKYDIKLNRDRI